MCAESVAPSPVTRPAVAGSEGAPDDGSPLVRALGGRTGRRIHVIRGSRSLCNLPPPPPSPANRPSVPSAPKPVFPGFSSAPAIPQAAKPAISTSAGDIITPAKAPPHVPMAPKPQLPTGVALKPPVASEHVPVASSGPAFHAPATPPPDDDDDDDDTPPPDSAAPSLPVQPPPKTPPPIPGNRPSIPVAPKPGSFASISSPALLRPMSSVFSPVNSPERPPTHTRPAIPAIPPPRVVQDEEFLDLPEQSEPSDSGRLSSTGSVSDVAEEETRSRHASWAPPPHRIDRSLWGANVLMKHQELVEVKERVRPLDRSTTFGKMYGAGRPEVKRILSRDLVMQLVMQHLHNCGLRLTRQRLEDETKIKYRGYPSIKESRLRAILKRALMEVDYLVDASVADKDAFNLPGCEEELINRVSLLVPDEEAEADDRNIWDEPPDDKSNILFAEGPAGDSELAQIKAATLNKLVERLTSEKSHDLKYMKTFLMTYQSFTTPEKLMQKLIERYQVPPPKLTANDNQEKALEDWKRSTVRPIQLRVCNVLKNWIEKHFSDFRDAVMAQLNDFIDSVLAKDGHIGLAKQLRNTIQKAQSGRVEKREIMFTEAPPEVKVPKNIFSPTLTILDVDDDEIARQLTCMEFDIYAAIQPQELLNQAWSKPKYHHRAPNVRGMAARFNLFSGWVATSILKEQSLRARTRVMTKFIRIAEHLRELNNFNSLMSILAGFNNSAVHRLKHTKAECAKAVEELFALEQQMSSNASYKKYREILHNVDPPCIPYLGVYLTDITFVEDGNPDLINSLINFAKRKLVNNVIVEIQQYQQRPYNVQPVQQIQRLLQRIRTAPDSELYRLSMDREPRGVDRADLT